MQRITAAVKAVVPDADVTIRTVPRQVSGENIFDRIRGVAALNNVTLHDLSVQQDKDGLHVEQHVEVAESLPLVEAHRFVCELEEQMYRAAPEVSNVLTHIESEPATIEASAASSRTVSCRRSCAVWRERCQRSSTFTRLPYRAWEITCTSPATAPFPTTLPMHRVHDVITSLEDRLKLKCPEVYRMLVHPEPEADNRHEGRRCNRIDDVNRRRRMMAKAEWQHDQVYTATSDSGHSLTFDVARVEGPTPTECVLMSLCACTAVDVISILTQEARDLHRPHRLCKGRESKRAAHRVHRHRARLSRHRFGEPQEHGGCRAPVEGKILLRLGDAGKDGEDHLHHRVRGRMILRLFQFALVLVLLVVVAMVSALTTMRFAIHGAEVKVPDFRGMSEADARRKAAEDGLEMSIDDHFYSTVVPESRIVTQAPAAGTIVRTGWQVRVGQSLGAQKVAVPSLLHDQERVAALTIRRASLQLGTIAHMPYALAEAGTVIAQSPDAGAASVDRPTVALLMSAPVPPEATGYVMPDFINQPEKAAEAAVSKAGLKLAPTLYRQAEIPPVASIAAPGEAPCPAGTPHNAGHCHCAAARRGRPR